MAKKGKAKLPKQVAGVKVPKRLRKSGKSFAGLFKSPLGREILADALVAAAGAAAAALVRNRPSAAEVKDAGVVAEAARQVLPTSLTGDSRDGDRDRRRDRDRFAVLAAEGGRKKGKGKDKSREH